MNNFNTADIITIIMITLVASQGWRIGGKEGDSILAKYGYKIFGASFGCLMVAGLLDLVIESVYINSSYKYFLSGLASGIILVVIDNYFLKKNI
jgi:hypothetical protein